MDELEFRRRVYADPDTTEVEILEAAQNDTSKLAFLNDMRVLNGQLRKAADIPVPEDLAHKLIWQQSMTEHVRQKRQTKWYVALAASVAFMIGIGFTLTQQAQVISLGNAALAHMDHANAELKYATTPVTLELVNNKLQEYGAQLVGDMGKIEVANYCYLEKIRSLHMIIESEFGPVSVFVVPHDDKANMPEQFDDAQYKGMSFEYKRANLMVVGDKSADMEAVTEKVRKSIQFSA